MVGDGGSERKRVRAGGGGSQMMYLFSFACNKCFGFVIMCNAILFVEENIETINFVSYQLLRIYGFGVMCLKILCRFHRKTINS